MEEEHRWMLGDGFKMEGDTRFVLYREGRTGGPAGNALVAKLSLVRL
jgi:hypothetical protein